MADAEMGSGSAKSAKKMPHMPNLTEDEMRLARCGYKQETKRIFTAWSNFGLAASMISVILGIIPLYTYSLTNGGKRYQIEIPLSQVVSSCLTSVY
jgi:hypothetical protein